MTIVEPSPGNPKAEVDTSPALVQALLAQHGIDCAQRTVTQVGQGWDNVMYRISALAQPQKALERSLVVRMPRRAAAVSLLANEQRWLPQLLPTAPLPIPRPLLLGQPGQGYPWPFSVLPWLPGSAADLAPPNRDQATLFADFFAALHQPAPAAAPHNPFRGVPLATRQEGFEARWQRSAPADTADRVKLAALWEQAVGAPIDQPPVWIHGDPHPRNLLVEDGKLSAVIDWGDVCAGDRATDLAGIWLNFHDPNARRDAIARYQALAPHTTSNTWLRAQGWALLLAIVLLDSGRINDPRHRAIGERSLQTLLADL